MSIWMSPARSTCSSTTAAARAAWRRATRQRARSTGHAERLGHVVVGAGVERLDHPRFVGLGGHDDDRAGHARPHVPAQHQPVDVGEPEVDDDQRRVHRVDEFEAGGAGTRHEHTLAARLERGAQHLLLRPVVLDDHDRAPLVTHGAP